MKNEENYIAKLLRWFEKNKRSLSFREDKDPYKIWISEIMAQQTQIDTLIPYYNHFVERFPNIDELANADEDEVLKYWEGLGYYSRAKNLHKCAKILQKEYQSKFPSDEKLVLKLPGIGPYTCGAILSIAFNQPIPAVDGNVLRVITRIKHWDDDIANPQTKKKITTYLQEIIPENAADFNESLMELGALICSPKNPKCSDCPIAKDCITYQKMDWNRIPVKQKKQKQKQKQIQIEVGIVHYKDLFYIVKRPNSGLLANLWAFPSIEAINPNGSSIQALLLQSFPLLKNKKLIGKSKHIFTHRIWNMNIYQFELTDLKKDFSNSDKAMFVSIEEIKQTFPLPTAFSKLLEFIQ